MLIAGAMLIAYAFGLVTGAVALKGYTLKPKDFHEEEGYF